MRSAALLENVVQPYAWGSRTAIGILQGREVPTPTPEAELWMGAHPRAPSMVVAGDVRISMIDFIARDPAAVLGAAVTERFGGTLPFLFKVLAAETPLSIQVHPNRSQAGDGFEREDRMGIPRDAPHRNYRDTNHKPEIICAMTDFTALNGFRPASDIAALMRQTASPALAGMAQRFEDGVDPRSVVADLLRADPEWCGRAVTEAVGYAAGGGGDDPVFHWLPVLNASYPNDPGVLCAMLLNLVQLVPGQSMYMGPGRLHAYLQGTGIELMANSDNVLRSGLTVKHRDPDELLRLLSDDFSAPSVIAPEAADDAVRCYATPAEEFELAVIDLVDDRPFNGDAGTSLEILLCTAGAGRLENVGLVVKKGMSVVVPASAGRYCLTGKGRFFRARVPSR